MSSSSRPNCCGYQPGLCNKAADSLRIDLDVVQTSRSLDRDGFLDRALLDINYHNAAQIRPIEFPRAQSQALRRIEPFYPFSRDDLPVEPDLAIEPLPSFAHGSMPVPIFKT